MASIIHNVVSNYNELLQSNRDPELDNWLLMGSPGPVLSILGLYLLFVLKIGPKFMENRPPFKLKNILILYNAFQVLFSIWLSSLALKKNVVLYIFTDGCKPHAAGVQHNPLQHLISYGGWWYFFSKIIELLDTVFFVLRKKQNQISFLHVYHHTITALFSWCYLTLLPGEQGIVLGLLNSVVHVVMYGYYLIAALGPKYRKYLWWKKYMTWIQLVQFGLMLVYLMFLLVMDCNMSKPLTYFLVANVIIFIYLFSDFYRKSYGKKEA